MLFPHLVGLPQTFAAICNFSHLWKSRAQTQESWTCLFKSAYAISERKVRREKPDRFHLVVSLLNILSKETLPSRSKKEEGGGESIFQQKFQLPVSLGGLV